MGLNWFVLSWLFVDKNIINVDNKSIFNWTPSFGINPYRSLSDNHNGSSDRLSSLTSTFVPDNLDRFSRISSKWQRNMWPHSGNAMWRCNLFDLEYILWMQEIRNFLVKPNRKNNSNQTHQLQGPWKSRKYQQTIVAIQMRLAVDVTARDSESPTPWKLFAILCPNQSNRMHTRHSNTNERMIWLRGKWIRD